MAIMETGCRALLINGGGGVGKTAVGTAIAGVLTARRYPTALVDLDALSQFGPSPEPGPPPPGLAGGQFGFHDRLRLRNLRAVCGTYRAAGARFLVVSGVIESGQLRAAYAECLAGCDVQMVRLETPPDLVEQRTHGTARGPRWDLQAALKSHQTLAHSEDFTVSNDRPLADVAAEILVMAGWISGDDG